LSLPLRSEVTNGLVFCADSGYALIPGLGARGFARQLIYIAVLLGAVAILILGKRFITLPRMGIVRFAARRTRRVKSVMILGVFCFIAALILIPLRQYIAAKSVMLSGAFVGLIITAPLSLLAYWLDFPRLALVGILFTASVLGSELLYPLVGEPRDGLISFGASGLILIIIGLALLRKFVAGNSVTTEALPEGEHE